MTRAAETTPIGSRICFVLFVFCGLDGLLHLGRRGIRIPVSSVGPLDRGAVGKE